MSTMTITVDESLGIALIATGAAQAYTVSDALPPVPTPFDYGSKYPNSRLKRTLCELIHSNWDNIVPLYKDVPGGFKLTLPYVPSALWNFVNRFDDDDEYRNFKFRCVTLGIELELNRVLEHETHACVIDEIKSQSDTVYVIRTGRSYLHQMIDKLEKLGVITQPMLKDLYTQQEQERQEDDE